MTDSSPKPRRSPWRWPLIGIAVASVFCAPGFYQRSTGLEAEVKSILVVHDGVVDAYSSLQSDLHLRRISDVRFADAVEMDVIRPWSDARQRLDKLSTGTEGNLAKLKQLHAYFQLREQALQTQVRAIRLRDDDLRQRGTQLWDLAEKAGNELFPDKEP